MVLAIAALSSGVSTPVINPVGTSRHNFHVSHTRVAIENQVIVARTRFFLDDLTDTLARYSDADNFSLDTSPSTDSLFTSYYNQRFLITVKGKPLRGHIIGSGEDVEADEKVWWYALQYETPAEQTSVSISNTLLIEIFDDQKNVLKIQKFPSEKSSTYYFDSDETTVEVNF